AGCVSERTSRFRTTAPSETTRMSSVPIAPSRTTMRSRSSDSRMSRTTKGTRINLLFLLRDLCALCVFVFDPRVFVLIPRVFVVGQGVFFVLQSGRPVLFQQARHRAVCEDAAAGLAACAVVAFVVGVDDALHRRVTDRTWFFELAVDRHLGAERGHFLGE